jgi:hypothetical protein
MKTCYLLDSAPMTLWLSGAVNCSNLSIKRDALKRAPYVKR